VKTSGIDGMALTKLDILDGFKELKVCTGYKLDGEGARSICPPASDPGPVEPIYETIEGWEGVDRGARSWADLPAQAVKYVRRIEELVEAPVMVLSTSPDRDDTIRGAKPLELRLRQQRAQIQPPRVHRHLALLVPRPFLARPVAVELHAVAVGIPQVERLAHPMVRRAFQRDIGIPARASARRPARPGPDRGSPHGTARYAPPAAASRPGSPRC
jgi:hypothetical protein